MTREYHFKAEKLGFLAAPIKVDVSQGWTFIVNKDFPWEGIDAESIDNLVRAFFQVFFRDIFGVGTDPDYLDYMTVSVRAETRCLITKHRNQIIATKRMKGLMNKVHNSDAFNVVNSALALEARQVQVKPYTSIPDDKSHACSEGDQLNAPLDGIKFRHPPELEWANGHIQPTTVAQQPTITGVTPNAFSFMPATLYANQEREIRVTSTPAVVSSGVTSTHIVISPMGQAIKYNIDGLKKDADNEYLLTLHLNGYDKSFAVVYNEAAGKILTWTAGASDQAHYEVLLINRHTAKFMVNCSGSVTHSQGHWKAHLSARVINTLARLAERYQDKNKFRFWEHKLGLYHLEQLIKQLDLAK